MLVFSLFPLKIFLLLPRCSTHSPDQFRNLFNPVALHIAVSYTHLDVYKRQCDIIDAHSHTVNTNRIMLVQNKSQFQFRAQMCIRDRYNTYNMGIDMVLAVDAADTEKTMEAIKASGEIPYVLGEAKAGEKGVTLC